MIKKIKNHIKNNKGDTYIQLLICFSIFLPVLIFVFQTGSSMTQKMWLDDKINDITSVIAITGDVSCPEVEAIETNIKEKMGGTLTYSSSSWVDPTKQPEVDGRVQLGGIVNVNYLNEDYPVIEITDNFKLKIDINITRQSISEKYFKPPI